jgi:hypothetical protein
MPAVFINSLRSSRGVCSLLWVLPTDLNEKATTML